jgi:hypothetical protein
MKMETWFLVMALYHGGEVSTSFSKPVLLGPMPNMEICLKVASAMEQAGHGNIMAGCSIQYETSGSVTIPSPTINGCNSITCNNNFAR